MVEGKRTTVITTVRIDFGDTCEDQESKEDQQRTSGDVAAFICLLG